MSMRDSDRDRFSSESVLWIYEDGSGRLFVDTDLSGGAAYEDADGQLFIDTALSGGLATEDADGRLSLNVVDVVYAGYTPASDSVYGPTLTQSIGAGYAPASDESYGPTASYPEISLVGGYYTSDTISYCPTITQPLSAWLYEDAHGRLFVDIDGSGGAVYEDADGRIFIDTSLADGLAYEDADDLFFVSVGEGLGIVPGHFLSDEVSHGPRLDLNVSSGFVPPLDTVYGPRVSSVITAGWAPATNVYYGPSVALTISPGGSPPPDTRVHAYGPRLTIELIVAPGLYVDGTQSYGPVVAMTVGAGFMPAIDEYYGPQEIATGAFSLFAGYFEVPALSFPALVSPGAIQLFMGYVPAVNRYNGPRVIQRVLGGTYEDVVAVYFGPQIGLQFLRVTPGLFRSRDVFPPAVLIREERRVPEMVGGFGI